MNIIVFSKNRAAQLELFIRSFNKYVVNSHNYILKIIYTYTDPNYEAGYKKLMDMGYSNTHYIKETNFKEDILRNIDMSDKHIVFFVDDDVFKNPIDFYDEQMTIFNNDPEIICRSLRLHPRLTYCYPMAMPMTPPKFMDHNIFFWPGLPGDYGYPMSSEAHIFRTEQLVPLIKTSYFANPNTFEGVLASRPLRLPKMICYDKSITLNNPCNKVQTVNNNIHGNVDVFELNQRFLNGQLISLNNIDGIENISCHQEIPIMYEN